MMTNLLHGAHVANKLFSTIARLRLLLVMFVALTVSANAWGATITINGSASGITTTDGNQTITVDGITFKGKFKQYSTTALWFTSGSGYIYNTTSLGTINSITINYKSGGSGSSKQYFTSGNSAITSYQSGTPQITTSPGGDSGTHSSFSGGFFNISISNKNLQATSIVIDYTPAGGGETPDPTTYTINWHTAVGTVEDEVLEEGATITKPATDPTMTGYEFMGWTEDCEVASDGSDFTALTDFGTADSDKDFYAVFAKATPTGGGAATTTTASVVIKDYASAKSWANGTKYTTVEVDANITATVTGGTNTGKYYTSGNEWRLYQTESPTLTISAKNDINIKTVKVTYNVSNSGVLKLNSSNVTSGTVKDVNASSITFSVGNTSSATNGQVKVTAMEVVYTSGGGGTTTYDNYITTCATETTHYLLRK